MILPLLLAAAQPQVVAVLEFRDKVPPAQRIDAAYLSDQVRAAVKELLPGAKVITRENMLVLLEASGKKLEECEGECEVDTGRRIGADLVASGELLRFGTQYKLNMKLHDTRSGELISGAVASGTNADDLDRNLRPAVEKLLAPLRPEAAQDRLSEQRAVARRVEATESESGVRLALSAHATLGYGNVSGSGSLVALTGADISGVSTGLAFGGGVDVGAHLGSVFTAAVFGEYAGVAASKFVNVAAGGLLARVTIDAFSLSAGLGLASIGSTSGWVFLGAADYRVWKSLAARAQFLMANEPAKGTSTSFFGGDEVVAATAGVSVIY